MDAREGHQFGQPERIYSSTPYRARPADGGGETGRNEAASVLLARYDRQVPTIAWLLRDARPM